MRLARLKLAGFKTFVDPVTLHFEHNLTGIVGPNGCGKSNVMDAVRWVMGEASARQLRGELMSDVIFAGSTSRAPVSQASVELIFDQTAGRPTGPYAHYSELAIRRQVTRDGHSDYFLNGTKCRRRDITDIFLGTGLGPRSYAVIGQGMIHQLVEARPDELRLFIEEAAGVSRYQTRRRETQAHLSQTVQNVERLQDIEQALTQQIQQLTAQANAVEQLNSLQQKALQTEQHIESARYWRIEHNEQLHIQQLNVHSQQLLAHRQLQETHKAHIEAIYASMQTHMEKTLPLQQQWQSAEQQAAQLQAMALQAEQQFNRLRAEHLAAIEQQQQHVQSIERQRQELTQLEQALNAHNLLDNTHQLKPVETQLNDAEQQLLQLNNDYTALQQHVQQLQHRHQHSLSQLKQHEQQRERLTQEHQRLTHALTQLHYNDLMAQLEQLNHEVHGIQTQISDITQQCQTSTQALQQVEQAYQTVRQQHTEYGQKLNLLEVEFNTIAATLPYGSTPPNDADTPQTLIGPRLAECLRLRPAGQYWLKWLEIAFKSWLDAVVVEVEPDQDDFLGCFKSAMSKGNQPFKHAKSAMWIGVKTTKTPSLTSLQQATFKCLPVQKFLKTPLQSSPVLMALNQYVIYPQLSLWQGVYVTSARHDALPSFAWESQHKHCNAMRSVITSDGWWISADWCINLTAVHAAQGLSALGKGQLTQRQRLRTLTHDIEKTQEILQQLGTQQKTSEQLCLQQQQTHISLQKELERLRQQQHSLAIEQATLQQRSTAVHLQQVTCKTQLQQLNDDLQDIEALLEDEQLIAAQVLQHLTPLLAHYEMQTSTRQHLQITVQQLQKEYKEHLLQQHTWHLKQQQLISNLHYLNETFAQLIQQEHQSAKQHAGLAQQIQRLEITVSEHKQQAHSAQHKAEQAQQQWHTQQQQFNDLQQQLVTCEQKRTELQQQEQRLRDSLEQQRLNWQLDKQKMQQIIEQLDLKQLAILPKPALDTTLTPEHLQRLNRQIARLGPLNMVAVQELSDVQARYNELNANINDLHASVQQLKTAISQIDQQTQQLFMVTFNQINTHLGELFPKVFGGGQATLSLEDDDWRSGVRLMAQPPGKKNTRLALLSGGEKALTALALVFAIFQLNPAPFCLLDEVDAPLDDANVQRFCHLVTSLSQHVQFIFISHNKLAMQMATQLIGITMPSAGVSRVVSVNLEQATAFSS